MMSLDSRTASSTVARLKPGVTRNWAPASRQRRASSGHSARFPAPMRTSAPQPFASSRMTSIAARNVMVISTMGMPPLQPPRRRLHASRESEDARTNGNDSDFFDSTANLFVIHFEFLAYIIPRIAERKSFIRNVLACWGAAALHPYKKLGCAFSASNARADTLHHLQDFLKCDHGSVAGSRHRGRAP